MELFSFGKQVKVCLKHHCNELRIWSFFFFPMDLEIDLSTKALSLKASVGKTSFLTENCLFWMLFIDELEVFCKQLGIYFRERK